METRILVLFLLVAGLRMQFTLGRDCVGGDKYGDDDNGSANSDDGESDRGYIATDNKYKFDCCGIVSRLSIVGLYNSGTVWVQIWRPTTPAGTYELRGEQRIDITTTGRRDYTINPLSFDNGDFMGWYCPANMVIGYDSSGTEANNNFHAATGDLNIGNTYNFQGLGTLVNDRSYGIETSRVAKSSNPSFTNLPATTSISVALGGGSPVYTVTATDLDYMDVAELVLTKMTNNKFAFASDPTNSYIGYITVDAAATLTVGTETVDIVVTDPCGEIGTDTLTITVTNNSPIITSLPVSTPVTILESENVETLLHTLTITDADPGQTITCSLGTVTPPQNSFVVKIITGLTYGVYSTLNPGFDFDSEPNYRVDVSCRDGFDTDTETLDVSITKNLVSTIIFPSFSEDIVENFSPSSVTAVFPFTTSDPEGDAVTCPGITVVPNPAPAIFSVTSTSPANFAISVAPSTYFDFDLVTSYFITVDCTDGRRTTSNSMTMFIIKNEPPVVDVLSGSTSVLEEITAATEIHDFTATDPELDAVTCSVQSTVPPVAFFSTISTGVSAFSSKIEQLPNLNWDNIRQYAVTVYCEDSRRGNTGVILVDVIKNMPPVIDVMGGSSDVPEEITLSTDLHDFTATDPTGDTTTCSILSVAPAVTFFSVVKKAASDFAINIDKDPSLNYDLVRQYIIEVQCADARRSTTDTIIINVAKNFPAVMDVGVGVAKVLEETKTQEDIHPFAAVDPTGEFTTCSVASITPVTVPSIFGVTKFTGTTFALQIKDDAGLDFDIVQQYTVQVDCTDQRRVTSQTIIVNVVKNQPPTADLGLAVAEVLEEVSVETDVHAFTVADPTNDNVDCKVIGSPPESDLFFIEKRTTTDMMMKIIDSAGLNYDLTRQYQVQIECYDWRRSVFSTLTVNVKKNAPAVMDMGTVSIADVLEEITSSVDIYPFTVTDETNDAIGCSVTSTLPTPSPVDPIFRVTKHTATTFDLTIVDQPQLDFDNAQQFSVLVSCSDGRRTTTDSISVRVVKNQPPVIDMKGVLATIPEETTKKYLVHTFTVTDPTNDIISCGIPTVNPNVNLFTVTQTGPNGFSIYSKDDPKLNFDSIPEFILTITCSDVRRSHTQTLKVSVIPNEAPTITSLPASFDLKEETTLETDLHEILVFDPTGDAIDCVLDSMVPPGPFIVKQVSGSPVFKVYLEDGAVLSYSDPSHALTIKCSDARRSDTKILTVNLIRNKAPNITNLPYAVNVHEGEMLQQELHQLILTDNENDEINCEMGTMTPPDAPFQLWVVGDTRRDYVVMMDANPALSYDLVQVYIMLITCSDMRRSVTKEFRVNIFRDKAPIFKNLPATVTIDASTFSIGTKVFMADVTDSEGNPLQMTLSSDPAGVPFTILNSGEIIGSRSIITEGITGYNVQIDAYDEAGNNYVSQQSLTVLVENLNSPPVINNLPQSFTLSENSNVGMLVFTVVGLDTDPGDTLRYMATYNPSDFSVYFTLDTSTGVLSVQQNIDYETLGGVIQCDISFTVTDDHFTSDPAGILSITIEDENERPSFLQPRYSVEVPENVGGTVIFQRTTLVSDPDATDNHHFSMSCGDYTSKFAIGGVSGDVVFAGTFDYDEVDGVNKIQCTMEVEDKGGLVGTATLDVTVTDINDNPPILSKNTYLGYSTPDVAIGSTVIIVNASDADSGRNKDITFSLDQADLLGNYFFITQEGEIRVLSDLAKNFTRGSVLTFYVTAANDVDPFYTDTAKIQIVLPELEPTVAPAPIVPGFWNDPANVAWVTVAMIGTAVAAGLGIFMAAKYCRRTSSPKSFKPSPAPKAQPYSKPAQPTYNKAAPEKQVNREPPQSRNTQVHSRNESRGTITPTDIDSFYWSHTNYQATTPLKY